MNENVFLPIILQLAGVVVIIAEVFIPSGGVLAVVSLGLFGSFAKACRDIVREIPGEVRGHLTMGKARYR